MQLSYEETQPWCDVRIDTCEPPARLAVSMVDEVGNWRLELSLTEAAGRTELRFVQHLDEIAAGVDSIAPGWEYYLDMLVAAHEDTEESRSSRTTSRRSGSTGRSRPSGWAAARNIRSMHRVFLVTPPPSA